jgi:hypothetical protein
VERRRCRERDAEIDLGRDRAVFARYRHDPAVSARDDRSLGRERWLPEECSTLVAVRTHVDR